MQKKGGNYHINFNINFKGENRLWMPTKTTNQIKNSKNNNLIQRTMKNILNKLKARFSTSGNITSSRSEAEMMKKYERLLTIINTCTSLSHLQSCCNILHFLYERYGDEKYDRMLNMEIMYKYNQIMEDRNGRICSAD